MSSTMAAPRSAPAGVNATQHYSSPDVVPASWTPDRPGLFPGLQPDGPLRGPQGPDQGFALSIAARIASELRLQPGEKQNDAVRGCLGIALKRASLFSRAPVVHDVRLAFTIWGFFIEQPPVELMRRRHELFEGVGLVNHHYAEGRLIADLVPEETLRLTPEQAASMMPSGWQELTGA